MSTSFNATDAIEALFPLVPSEAPSIRSPLRLPGITKSSSDALINALKDNHVKWHAFFNDRGFHNHASHHLVAIYALGASGSLIEAAYQTHVVYMRPAFKSPEPVSEANFWKHLGKPEFYNSYLEYFRALLLKKDVSEVLEEYVFSSKANVGGTGIEGNPRMLTRFWASVLHPVIHTGCGLEFGILGLVAEGLAQTAIHPTDAHEIIPLSLFQTESSSAVNRLTALLPSLSLNKNPTDEANEESKPGVHAFTILGRLLADARFSPTSIGIPLPNRVQNFYKVNADLGDAIAALAHEWAAELDGDGATPASIHKKIEELAWMNALIYGVAGWAGRGQTDGKFNADFFYMHLVTSSVLIPSLVAYLTPRSAALLLQSYFATSLVWYITQGRPQLPIREFYAGTTAMPVQPGEPRVAPVKNTLTPDVASPNPWLPIVQTTLVHPAEHLCKIQRAFMHNATLYGNRGAGDFAGLGLEGAEVLDSTLFIRAAGLTADRIGWMKEGQEAGDWDRIGFF